MRAKILRGQLSGAPGFTGEEIADAAYIKKSPLFDGEEDLTEENVFIERVSWETVKRHLKRALTGKLFRQPNFLFRFTTDVEIKNVFVGAESYGARPRSVREDKETYNSVADLMGLHDLVICRLGRFGYKNIAGGGSLLEALKYRETNHLPTWLIDSEPGGTAWVAGPSWNPEVGTYVEAKFKSISLDDSGDFTPPPKQVPHGLGFDEEEESLNVADALLPKVEDQIPASPPEEPYQEEDKSSGSGPLIEMPGGGGTKKSNWKKSNWKGRR
jgi:hypothetical protein